MSLYTDCKAAGLRIDNHESDLYVRCSPEADAIVAKHDTHKTARRFYSQSDGAPWWDCPFSYDPFWEKRCPAKS